MFTRQETFDFVVGKLIEQGEPAAYSAVTCKYRLEKDGKVLKCAAGWCIPDDAYDISLEGLTVHHSRLAPLVKDHDISLLGRLQTAHDKSANHNAEKNPWLTVFKLYALEVAEDYGLDTSVLNVAK